MRSGSPVRIGPRRRVRFALLLAALAGVPLLLVLLASAGYVAMALSGASIDASRWNDAVARRASAALERPVILRGTLLLEPTLSRELAVRLGPLQVLNRTGFAGPELLAIGELRVRIDLFEALRGRFRSSSIEARDVDVMLERNAEGAGNWTAAEQRDPGVPQAVPDIERIVLTRVAVHYRDERSSVRRSVELDELSGRVGRDRPLRLAARGRLPQGHDYSVTLHGASLGRLDAEPWPFALAFDTGRAKLRVEGAVDAAHGTARLNLAARADDLASLEWLAGSPLPGVAGASVRCEVTYAADSLHIGDLHVRLGESDLSGHLAFAFGGARTHVGGALSASVLDLRPFLRSARAADESPATGSAAPAREALSLRDLVAVDADVDVKVEQWLGPGVDIRDARLAWHADALGVRAPMSAIIAGAPFAGALELDTSSTTPALTATLGANGIELGELARGFGAASSIDGTLGRVDVRMEGRGETTASLARDLRLSLALAGGRLRLGGSAGADPIVVAIDSLKLAASPHERLTGRARGTVQGQRATLNLRGGDLAALLQDRVLPLELDLVLAAARLRVDGALALAGSTGDTALRFDFRAARSGDLAGWLGVSPQSTLPVALRGQLRTSGTAWRLEDTALQVGRSQLTIDAASAALGGRERVAATVRSSLIDVQELSTLRADGANGANGRNRGTARPGAGPALPAAFDWPDADVDFRLQRIRLGRTDLDDLVSAVRMRDGRLSPLSIAGKVADAPFTATFEMDAQAAPPTLRLAVAAGAVDLGALLRDLGVAEDIDGRVQALQVNVFGRGSSVHEWVAHSGVELRVAGGSLVVRGAAGSALAEVQVDAARVVALPGERVHILLDGAIGETPLTLEATSGTLAELAADPDHVPFTLAAQAAGTRLALDGEVALPLGSGGKLKLAMRGERLDSLSALARVELPAWGPWSFSSPILMTATGYVLPDLHASVGGSRLEGRAAFDLSGPRPSLDVQVAAPTIQLDDFPLPERLTDRPTRSDDPPDARESARRLARKTDALLSAGFLRRLDATIDVKAREVLSGSDRLADGAVRLTLADGNLRLDPAVVNLLAGSFQLSLSYEPKGDEVEVGVAVQVDRFDYGILARRFDRTATLRGQLSLDVAMFGKAASLDRIARNASGRLDFAVWPVDLSGRAFNFWSVNLLLQLLPLVDPNARPTVNCIVGRFDLLRGDLTDDKMLIDTSAVRIVGSGHANLSTEQIDFVFRPRAKGLALFRLQTPLRVTGTLQDQRFGFTQFDVAESVLRLIASPVLLPLERLASGPLPRDGSDVCTDPLRSAAP